MHCNNHVSTDKTVLLVQVSRQGSAATSGVFSILLSISQHEITESFSETWLLESGDPQEPQHSDKTSLREQVTTHSLFGSTLSYQLTEVVHPSL